jgi:hypothetical protein
MDSKSNYRLVCGTISAFVATSIVHPFDILKISKQLNIKPQYNFTNLYRGYSIGLFRQLTYSVPNVYIFTELINKHKDHYDTEPNYYNKLLYGSISGAISGFTGNPSEVMMVRSINPNDPQRSIFTHFQNVYKTYGITGFLQGYKAAVLRSSIYNGIRLSLYSESKSHIQNMNPSLTGTTTLHIMSGAISTISAIIISNPIDVIKSRAQKEQSKTLTQQIQKSIKSDGFSLIHKGLIPSICKSFPHSIISFVILERSMRYFTGDDAI